MLKWQSLRPKSSTHNNLLSPQSPQFPLPFLISVLERPRSEKRCLNTQVFPMCIGLSVEHINKMPTDAKGLPLLCRKLCGLFWRTEKGNRRTGSFRMSNTNNSGRTYCFSLNITYTLKQINCKSSEHVF